jgi:hypothetical protein
MLKQGNGVCYVAYIILREEHERSHFGDVRTRRTCVPDYQHIAQNYSQNSLKVCLAMCIRTSRFNRVDLQSRFTTQTRS